jgi:uncharacterized repeat protein (TIGR04138 family)
MHTVNFEEVVEKIVARDPRYAREAYHFVREALDYTQKKVHREARNRKSRQDRHVTGQQLLEGLRDYGLQMFGPMSLYVLNDWGLRCCEDFGELVFNLVDHGNGMFGKTDQDSRNDFKGGYDFGAAFRQPYVPAAKSKPAAAPAKPS